MSVRALVVVAIAGLAACSTTSDISVTDNSTFIGAGRLSFDIAPRGASTSLGPSVPHTGHGIEIGLSGGSGEDTQRLDAGAPIVFGGRVFTAPNDLRHEFDFRFAELAYRYRHFFGAGTFGIEGLAGLGYARYDLTISSAIQRANEDIGSGGLVGGFGVIWKFRPTTSLQSRLTVFGSGETEGVTAAARWDLFVAQALGRHAALRAGVTAWSLASEREDNYGASINSPIQARFAGFALGLDVAF